MTKIGFEATPDVIATQEGELDWTEPARLLASVATPTLVLHGADDKPVPVEHAESIVAAMANARLEVITDGRHRPDIRSPELVIRCYWSSCWRREVATQVLAPRVAVTPRRD